MADVCLFAHFDRDAVVDPYVLFYLASLKRASFEVVFISASPLSSEQQAPLGKYCDDVIIRRDAGMDFGSWAMGLRKHGSAIGGRLLLANDSAYGPLGDLRPALSRLTAEACDYYGMIESISGVPHLQSWFLLFENHVVKSAAFQNVFTQSFETMNKDEIIRNGEVGLAKALQASGFRYRALYQPTRGGQVARSLPFNPANYLWRELIADEGVPFLKVNAVRNYSSEEDVRSIVGPRDAALPALIAAHQRRIKLPPQPMGIGHLIFRGFIRADHRFHRRKSRVLAALNFALCAALFKLFSRWLRRETA
jgi:lipopolysaccharide biosynthesis protein